MPFKKAFLGLLILLSIQSHAETSLLCTGDGRTVYASYVLIWGEDDVRIQDEESWLEAISPSEHVKGDAWKEIEGFPKFQKGSWMTRINDTPGFKERVIEIFDEIVVQNFKNKKGDASDFYDIDGEEEENDRKKNKNNNES